MTSIASAPRVLLISQWPNVKNGEYELIEKIKQTGYKIVVVDYLGFNVDTGESLNKASLKQDFDFAVSFHYDTPKFLNVPTFLWVANPLEFMHLRGDYRTTLLHHLRSYDGYLYNGSDTLKTHIRQVVGCEWEDTGLAMYPSCSVSTLHPPKADKTDIEKSRKLFYCGVNWERGIDRAGRAQGLLDMLQAQDAADFYGPNKLEGISPWEGFSSYRGEIPFDGVSMARVMQDYGAVLAVSSPAHMRSRTSSSRVFEGISAGVPVISDENAHVKKLFGDSVYYFCGNTEEQRAQSILDALKRINENPEEARHKVLQAQALMEQNYCFEPCFEHALAHLKQNNAIEGTIFEGKSLEIFLLHHDADSGATGNTSGFHNLDQIIEAASHVARRHGVQVQITCCSNKDGIAIPSQLPARVSCKQCAHSGLTDQSWERLRLGEKIALLAQQAEGDFSTFLTQFDFPQYDCFSKALDWFAKEPEKHMGGIHIGGFYVNDLTKKAPLGTAEILRNNSSISLYRWTQNSLGEHQMASLLFGKGALTLLVPEQLARFDAILPVSIIAAATGSNLPLHRSRHILIRAQYSHFSRHYDAYRKATEKGFWAQHYDLVTNYNHELNALYDVHHESMVAREIADQISGHALPPIPTLDPAVHAVNQAIGKLRPIYRVYKKFKRILKIR